MTVRIRQIDRTAGTCLHGDEVLPSDDFEDRVREPDLPRAVHQFRVHAPQSDQEIDAIAVAILDLEQRGNRVIDIAGPEHGFVALLNEGLSQRLRLTDLQRYDGVSIEAGAHDPVHRRRHGTDDRISNAVLCKKFGDVGHQQRRLTLRASAHSLVPCFEVAAERTRRLLPVGRSVGNEQETRPDAARPSFA
jgi:hypothetical protein